MRDGDSLSARSEVTAELLWSQGNILTRNYVWKNMRNLNISYAVNNKVRDQTFLCTELKLPIFCQIKLMTTTVRFTKNS